MKLQTALYRLFVVIKNLLPAIIIPPLLPAHLRGRIGTKDGVVCEVLSMLCLFLLLLV